LFPRVKKFGFESTKSNVRKFNVLFNKEFYDEQTGYWVLTLFIPSFSLEIPQ